MPCRVCASRTAPFATAQVLGKHMVQYFRCAQCGVVQTETPFWLDEAYASAITTSDLGMVSRNVSLARTCRVMIKSFFRQDAAFVDYGGGYGLFVRLMRDHGFDFYRYDKYCDNLFARGFDVESPPSRRYELVTAFEVFEHLVDPLTTIEEMLSLSDNIFFSTTLVPEATPKPGEWWYYGLEHGQHVVFYTARALDTIARKHGLFLQSKNDLHLLTRKEISAGLFRLAASRTVGAWLDRLTSRGSFLESDYAAVLGTERGSSEIRK